MPAHYVNEWGGGTTHSIGALKLVLLLAAWQNGITSFQFEISLPIPLNKQLQSNSANLTSICTCVLRSKMAAHSNSLLILCVKILNMVMIGPLKELANKIFSLSTWKYKIAMVMFGWVTPDERGKYLFCRNHVKVVTTQLLPGLWLSWCSAESLIANEKEVLLLMKVSFLELISDKLHESLKKAYIISKRVQ